MTTIYKQCYDKTILKMFIYFLINIKVKTKEVLKEVFSTKLIMSHKTSKQTNRMYNKMR